MSQPIAEWMDEQVKSGKSWTREDADHALEHLRKVDELAIRIAQNRMRKLIASGSIDELESRGASA